MASLPESLNIVSSRTQHGHLLPLMPTPASRISLSSAPFSQASLLLPWFRPIPALAWTVVVVSSSVSLFPSHSPSFCLPPSLQNQYTHTHTHLYLVSLSTPAIQCPNSFGPGMFSMLCSLSVWITHLSVPLERSLPDGTFSDPHLPSPQAQLTTLSLLSPTGGPYFTSDTPFSSHACLPQCSVSLVRAEPSYSLICPCPLQTNCHSVGTQ